MPVVIRFRINEQADTSGQTSYEEVAKKLARQGRDPAGGYPKFVVFGNPQYPDATVVEWYAPETFAAALQGVKQAIADAGVQQFCTGGDLYVAAITP
jgi:hypothetical protein